MDRGLYREDRLADGLLHVRWCFCRRALGGG